MGLFKKSNPQDDFEGTGFTVTRTLLDPPRLSFLPALYQDEPARRWAVKYRSADPTFFSYADVLGCEIVEMGELVENREMTRPELAQEIIANPSRAAKRNADKHDVSVGVGVIVAVRMPHGGMKPLQIPVFTGELKRSSAMFARVQDLAGEIRDEFLSMKETGNER